ncbi:leucine-rich repeat-containing protein 15-like [Mytilus californianus]|uniref:leucine-rich repeat-containing protein 15-like n=1 Tax=Mytilus californianus TaxID=6549 RepID=UPI002246BE97|nr:leucine-rich repeat-containing protein 15-like [Mytilus californianus]
MIDRYIYALTILLGTCAVLVTGCPTTCTCLRKNSKEEVTCSSGGSLQTIISTLDASTSYLEVISTTVNSLSPTDFSGITATNLKTLILRNCYISNIYDNSFELLSNIVNLNLTHNSISTISTNAFAGLTNLRSLDLSSNRISELGEQLLPLVHLQKLDLGENLLTDLNSGVFRTLTHLQILTLNGNKLENLHGDGLKGLGSLKRLNLRHCDLTAIPSDLFANSRIVQILDIGFNRVVLLPSSEVFVQKSPYLNTLIADGNRIESLKRDQFSNMHMAKLCLAKNRIRQIQYGVFDHFDVQELDLSENVISSIHRNAFSQIALQLTKLNLAGNPLGTIPEGCLNSLYRLQHLNLSMCALNHLDIDEFGKLQRLETLDLSRNRIPYTPQPVLDSFNHMSQVNIEQNAWHCDCHILPFRRWLSTSNVGNMYCSSLYSLDCRHPKCSSPPKLAGQIIKLTDERDLKCEKVTERSPLKKSQVIGISVGCIICFTIIIAIIIICIRHSQGKISLSCNDSQISSTELGDKDRSTKPFHDPEVGSLDESDKSFVVRNFFHSMVPNPSAVSRGSPEMSRKELDVSHRSQSYSTLNSVGYNPMGRESAV